LAETGAPDAIVSLPVCYIEYFAEKHAAILEYVRAKFLGLERSLVRRTLMPSNRDDELACKMYRPVTAQAMPSNRSIIVFEVTKDASGREMRRGNPETPTKRDIEKAILPADSNVYESLLKHDVAVRSSHKQLFNLFAGQESPRSAENGSEEALGATQTYVPTMQAATALQAVISLTQDSIWSQETLTDIPLTPSLSTGATLGAPEQDTPYERHLSIEIPSGVNIPRHHDSSPLRPNSFLPTRVNQHRCGRCIDPSTKLCQNCRRKTVEAHHRQMRVEQLRALQEKLVTPIPLLKSASRPDAI
jgi:hypothetical protein